VEIVGLSFESVFFGANRALAAAEKLNWPLILLRSQEEQIELFDAALAYGYGRISIPALIVMDRW